MEEQVSRDRAPHSTFISKASAEALCCARRGGQCEPWAQLVKRKIFRDAIRSFLQGY